MITQQCGRCKKKETYASSGAPTLFKSYREEYCLTCQAGWVVIEAGLLENSRENIEQRRKTYWHLNGED